MKAVIFVGPSLPSIARQSKEPSITWRPPVRQGDVYRAALARPAIIGIIDGYFEVTPTVWHKEILWAMAQGIHVYGAASLGALRAAELDIFGMKGIGRIYEDFRDGVLQDDDEVAVLHGPAELGYPPVTEAMVNIRATLAAAVREGVIAPSLAVVLTDIGKSFFYKERTYDALFKRAAETRLPAAPLRALRTRLLQGRVDQKRDDAAAMVQAIRDSLAMGVSPLRVSYSFAATAMWENARAGMELPPQADARQPIDRDSTP
jgi:hypothetical protein